MVNKIEFNSKPQREKWGCGCAIINSKNELLLGLRNKPGDKKEWCFFGGSIEDGETPVAAVKREVKEECGLTANSVEFVHCFDGEVKDYLFICRDFDGEIKLQEEEMSEYRWFNLEELRQVELFTYTINSINQLLMMGLIDKTI